MFYEIHLETKSNNKYTHKFYEREEAVEVFIAIGGCEDVAVVNLIDGSTGEIYGIIKDQNLTYWYLGD